MTNINVTGLRKNLFEYLQQAVVFNDVINVSTKNGNAVIISEEDYENLIETVYIMSHQGTYAEIIEAKNAPAEDFIDKKDVEW